jgi:hypothetical protein
MRLTLSPANLILPMHNRTDKGKRPAKCFLTRRIIEIELIFMRKRRAVISREEEAVHLDAEGFELSSQSHRLRRERISVAA